MILGLYWGYMRTMENEKETTLQGLGFGYPVEVLQGKR